MVGKCFLLGDSALRDSISRLRGSPTPFMCTIAFLYLVMQGRAKFQQDPFGTTCQLLTYSMAFVTDLAVLGLIVLHSCRLIQQM